ncbi:MAG: hypothetical protein ACOYXB_06055 [Bacteroidota bacterium]
MYQKHVIIFIFLALALTACNRGPEKEISRAVDRILTQYPVSNLQDLYKSFFQDAMGPGHLIGDPESARAYLIYEMGEASRYDSVLLEPAGYKGNFYRVNLSLVADSIIPADTFLRYFVTGINGFRVPGPEGWKKEWKVILSVIQEEHPELPGLERDKMKIDSLLEAGVFVGHHSQAYTMAYEPHYRLIDRKLFDEHLRKYLKKNPL